MPSYCPECGGEMQYVSISKRYVCKSCGLSLTQQELIEMREQLRGKPTLTEKEERAQQRKEYLKWWLSKKK